ncbi:MAG: hypothetical protein ACFE9R_14405 [Candidatus Hermodarchaeota archaeon]
MENDKINQLNQILGDFLSELQIKMENFLEKLNLNVEVPLQNVEKAEFSNLNLKKEEFIKKFRAVLERSQLKAMIIVPTLKDIEELEVYNVKSGVNLNIACFNDFMVEENKQLFEELESFGNIEIRNYEGVDRWVILRDGEELLCALVGTQEDNYLVLHTTDSEHIKILSNLATDAWLRSRKK